MHTTWRASSPEEISMEIDATGRNELKGLYVTGEMEKNNNNSNGMWDVLFHSMCFVISITSFRWKTVWLIRGSSNPSKYWQCCLRILPRLKQQTTTKKRLDSVVSLARIDVEKKTSRELGSVHLGLFKSQLERIFERMKETQANNNNNFWNTSKVCSVSVCNCCCCSL